MSYILTLGSAATAAGNNVVAAGNVVVTNQYPVTVPYLTSDIIAALESNMLASNPPYAMSAPAATFVALTDSTAGTISTTLATNTTTYTNTTVNNDLASLNAALLALSNDVAALRTFVNLSISNLINGLPNK